MTTKLVGVALGVLAFVAATGGTANAGGTPAQKCASTKIKLAGKKAACLGGLRAKEAAGGGLDPVKVQGCKNKFSAAYDKAELKPPCGTTGDTMTEETKVDNFIDDVVSELPNSAPACSC